MAAEGGSPTADLTPGPRPVAPAAPEAAAPGDHSARAGPVVRLEGVVGRLFGEPYRFSFYQAVRLLHRIFPGREAVARGGGPGDEPVRFAAPVSLSFPPSTVADLTVPTVDDPTPRLTQAFLGLTGPSGVLPRHYTERLIRLLRDTRGMERTALRDWFDVFNHRAVSQFYRAWEKYRFHLAFERGEHDRDTPDPFTQALLSLVGLGLPPLRGRLGVFAPIDDDAPEARPVARGRPRGRRRERVLARADDLALLYYAGFFAHRPRNAVSLEAFLADYFALPARVQQFRGQWLLLESADRTRLGGMRNGRLGFSAVAGERVWSVQSKIRVRLGPMTYDRFLDFLPDRSPVPERKTFFVLGHLVRLYAGPELDAEVQLVLRGDEVPAARLGGTTAGGPGSRLGWNSWLRSVPAGRDADDAVFALREESRLNGAAGA